MTIKAVDVCLLASVEPETGCIVLISDIGFPRFANDKPTNDEVFPTFIFNHPAMNECTPFLQCEIFVTFFVYFILEFWKDNHMYNNETVKVYFQNYTFLAKTLKDGLSLNRPKHV